MSYTNQSSGEHYNLRWNNFLTNLLEVFSELQKKEQMVDVTLVCEGKQIKAHKVILSATSGFFMNAFQNLKQTDPVLILFHQIKFTDLMHIVTFLYQGEVKVADAELEGVLSLGERFDVKGLSSVKMKSSDTEHANSEVKKPIQFEITTWKTQQSVDNISDGSGIYNEHTPVLLQPRQLGPTKRFIRIKSNEVEKSAKQFKEQKIPLILNRSRDKDRKFELKLNNFQSTAQKTVKNDNIKIEPEEIIDLSDSDSIRSSTEEKQSDNNITPSNNRTEKPVNAFILFSKEWRKKLQVEHPNEDFKSISVRLGNLWKSLSSETRETYLTFARQEQLNKQSSYSDLDNSI